jgi:LacI family transcriptional regulator
VLVGRNPAFAHYCVDVNNREAAEELTEYMVARGYRRIVLLVPGTRYFYSFAREAGYRAALDRHGLPVRVVSIDAEYREAALQLETAADWADAWLISQGGDLLVTVVTAFRRAGRELGDFGVSIFDDWQALEFLNPPLTAVRQPVIGLGCAATENLVALMTGDVVPPLTTILPATIVPRKSCGE